MTLGSQHLSSCHFIKNNGTWKNNKTSFFIKKIPFIRSHQIINTFDYRSGEGREKRFTDGTSPPVSCCNYSPYT
ncbi:unnamed protein product [Ixodes pacificus]